MRSNNLFLSLFAFMAIISFSACEDDNDDDEKQTTQVSSQYIVAASSGENDYLVAGSVLDADSTYDATSADAVQAAGDRTWSFYGTDVVYGFLYNQGDAGVTASYILGSDGTISVRNQLTLDVSIQTRGIVNDKLVLAYSDRLKDTTAVQYGTFIEIDPSTDISSTYSIVTDDLLEDGEAAYFTDVAEYEGYMIAGARSISSSSFSSDYYNKTYVVVFNSDYSVKQVIADSGRTGFVAGQKYSQGETGLEVVESGDLYVFSTGQTSYSVADSITIPSGVLKINQGDFAFDDDYFFDISSASNGYNLFRSYYMGGTTFILSMYPGTNSNATFGVDADRFAVVDVSSKTFEWVSSFPEADGSDDDAFSVGTPFIDETSSQLVVPVTTSDDYNYLYTIDPSTAVATQTSQVVAESVKAIGILEVADEE